MAHREYLPTAVGVLGLVQRRLARVDGLADRLVERRLPGNRRLLAEGELTGQKAAHDCENNVIRFIFLSAPAALAELADPVERSIQEHAL